MIEMDLKLACQVTPEYMESLGYGDIWVTVNTNNVSLNIGNGIRRLSRPRRIIFRFRRYDERLELVTVAQSEGLFDATRNEFLVRTNLIDDHESQTQGDAIVYENYFYDKPILGIASESIRIRNLHGKRGGAMNAWRIIFQKPVKPLKLF